MNQPFGERLTSSFDVESVVRRMTPCFRESGNDMHSARIAACSVVLAVNGLRLTCSTSAAGGLYNPRGLKVDTQGKLIIADTLNNALRVMTPAPVTP